jgi:hypothetical protein
VHFSFLPSHKWLGYFHPIVGAADIGENLLVAQPIQIVAKQQAVHVEPDYQRSFAGSRIDWPIRTVRPGRINMTFVCRAWRRFGAWEIMPAGRAGNAEGHVSLSQPGGVNHFLKSD